jgi:transcriptional regulator with XRE-family HTH domain
MDIRALGKAIRTRREAIGLTQDKLAKLAGLSRQTVQRLEAGTIRDLSFQRVSTLLKVLGLNFEAPTTAIRLRKRGDLAPA